MSVKTLRRVFHRSTAAGSLHAGGRIVNVTSELGALSDLPSDAYRHQIENAETLDALRAIKFVPDDAGCRAAVEKGYKGIGLPVYRCCGLAVLQPRAARADLHVVSELLVDAPFVCMLNGELGRRARFSET